MAKGDALARMRSNPQGDWTIADVQAVCRRAGLVCLPPSNGSHWKVSHPALRNVLTVLARRPIKPVYIRKPVQMVDEAGG